jgi:hypothetical protein
LNSIDGDGHFVDSDFITAPPKASPKLSPSKSAASSSNLSPEQQLEQEYVLKNRRSMNQVLIKSIFLVCNWLKL